MRKSILYCFCSSSVNRESSFQLSTTKDLEAVYSSYSEYLNKICQSLSHGSVSLQWSVEAMKILKKIQIELLVLIRQSSLPISSATEDSWFNQYMKDSISILDFCNSIKFAVSRVDQFRIMVDVMIKKLDKNGGWCTVLSETLEFGRQEIESQKYSAVRMVKETVGKGSIEDMSINSVMLAAKSSMDVVSVLLHSAIVSPVSTELGGCDLASRYPQLNAWVVGSVVKDECSSATDAGVCVCMFARNHLDFPKKRYLELKPFIEMLSTTSAVENIQAQVIDGIEDKERFFTSLELLRISSVGLKEGIYMLDAAVDDVFDTVIKGRNEMLGVVRDRDLTIG